MNKIATDSFKEIIRIDLDIKPHAVNSKYNGQSLATDIGYRKYLNSKLKKFKDSFIEIDIQNSQIQNQLNFCIRSINDTLQSLEKEKFNIEKQADNEKDQLNHIADVIERGYQKEQIDILNSVLIMMDSQKECLIKTKEFISELSYFPEPRTNKQSIKKDTNRNTKPSNYFIANVSPKDFISIFCTLQQKGVIGDISRSKLATFLDHIQFNSAVEVNSLLDDHSRELKLENSEFISWNTKNILLSEWIWWMISHRIIEEPNTEYTSLASFFNEIFYFSKSKRGSNISESIRKQLTPAKWKNSKDEIYVGAESIFNNYLNKFIPNEDLE